MRGLRLIIILYVNMYVKYSLTYAVLFVKLEKIVNNFVGDDT